MAPLAHFDLELHQMDKKKKKQLYWIGIWKKYLHESA